MKVLGFESSCDETGVALVETRPDGPPRHRNLQQRRPRARRGESSQATGIRRVQVRRRGFYRNQTFPTKRQAREWAEQIEGQIADVQAKGYHLPKGLTLGGENGLIDLYRKAHTAARWGRRSRA